MTGTLFFFLVVLFFVFFVLHVLYLRRKLGKVETRIHDDNNRITSALNIQAAKMQRIESVEAMLGDIWNFTTSHDQKLKELDAKASELEKIPAIDLKLADLSPIIKGVAEKLRSLDIKLELLERLRGMESKIEEMAERANHQDEKLHFIDMALKEALRSPSPPDHGALVEGGGPEDGIGSQSV